MMCKLGFHKWGMMALHRLDWSRDLVWGHRCHRCGKLDK